MSSLKGTRHSSLVLSGVAFAPMPWVVFLRAVNVGGANRCRPAELAKQLAKFGVVNIGAVGTFLVRELGGPFCVRRLLTNRTVDTPREILV